ncbi:hypothetical protein SRABI36_02541 [Pedobacter sp. Bi36]|nr:hypothetical protein SRABI126_00141 [Pedobacter sp. Bi126]CAH0223526.1 hypothetical protein SRABI36_02541 [Pedobacter sp. Bi36]
MKSKKLPQKNTQIVAQYKSLNEVNKRPDSDTTTVATTIISSTHIFNQ